MTKSFLEIAREIAELVEMRVVVPNNEALRGEHCPYCLLKELDDDDHECAGFEPDIVTVVDEPILDRETELSIEAILRREFEDRA